MGQARVEKDTVSMYFVRSAVARLDAPATARALAQAGIHADLVANPQARVPAQAFSALWLAVAHELDDEFFGLDSRRAKVGTFALVARASLHTGSLGQAVRTCLRGFDTVFDDIEGSIREERGVCVLEIENRIDDPDARRFAEETLLVMVYGLMCFLAGKRIPLDRIDFALPKPGHADEYKLMFTSAIGFDADRTTVRFDARHLAAPVVPSDSKLSQFLRAAPQSVFLKYRDSESFVARLRRRLRRAPGDSFPTLDEVAKELHVAESTLRRRLDHEGTTYQAVKDDYRRDLAIDHLVRGDETIADIARELGFRDASAFHRAFKKWTGTSPGAYRGMIGERPKPAD